jgi:hypothetical protein
MLLRKGYSRLAESLDQDDPLRASLLAACSRSPALGNYSRWHNVSDSRAQRDKAEPSLHHVSSWATPKYLSAAPPSGC